MAPRRHDVGIFLSVSALRRSPVVSQPPRRKWQLGCFAAIYHPVGIAMVVQGRVKNGMPLAVNRVFGNPKFTAAPLLTGAILDLYDWKWAFIIPSVFSIAASIANSFFLKAGDRGSLYPTEAAANKGAAISIDRGVVVRVFAVIFHTTALGGFI